MAKRKVKKEEKKEEEYEPEAAKKPKAPKKTKTRKSQGRSLRVFLNIKSKNTKEKLDKPDKKNINGFAQIRDDGDIVMTTNVAFNNIEKEGERFFKKVFGVDIVPGTPMVMDLTIPEGALYDDWEKAVKENPDQTDLEDDF